MLHGPRNFANVIKLKILRCRDGQHHPDGQAESQEFL